MEIEAKFAVPDLSTFQRLQAVDHVAGFALSAHQVQQVRDTYLDTDERLILVSGYACRCRETESEILITLKGLGRAEGAIHRRRELEISLPAYEPPQDWPESPVRDLVLSVTGDKALLPLFELRQTRVFRRMSQGELLVAQFSLDNVRFVADDRRRSRFELEVELAPQGTASDMGAIVTYLQDEWDLVPEPRSKFERALEFIDEKEPGGAVLTPQERAILVQVSRRQDLYGYRARGLLLLDEETNPDEVAAETSRTARTIRRWLKTFNDKRLAAFPERVLRAVQTSPAAILPQIGGDEPEDGGIEEASLPSPEPQPLKTLFKRFLVDRDHARFVAERAVTLFDHLASHHSLPPERRSLVETAAMVHNLGRASGGDKHHTAGRDILLTYPPRELDEEERLMVALTTYLHARQMTSKKLDKKASKTLFHDLPKRARDEALALSALVRMADGLDYSQTQSSGLGGTDEGEGVTGFEVTGPYAAIDAARAEEKSDLWGLLFDEELRFRPAPVGNELVPFGDDESRVEAVIPIVPEELPHYPDLFPDDSMGEAARKTMAYHFQHMLFHEPGTRAGDDPEELHDMRVATRRMRAAFQVFGDYVDGKALKPIRKGAQRTCSSLGSVRDLDVFWGKTEAYLGGLPAERRVDLMGLRETWEADRERAREEMLAFLDGGRYRQFKEASVELLRRKEPWETPGLTKEGEAIPRLLRHVVPSVVYGRAAAVLAYDEWVGKPKVSLKGLHRLRIAGKRLRYTLEFFEEVLAPQTSDLVKQVKRLQDHLGDLQDAVVASELLRDFLTWGTWGDGGDRKKSKMPPEPVVAPGVAIYMADKQAELQRLLNTFPEVWTYFRSREFKQTVAVVVAPL